MRCLLGHDWKYYGEFRECRRCGKKQIVKVVGTRGFGYMNIAKEVKTDG